ncbi:asparagine--tRNA ligase, partial [Candidatus Dependentiae bacterium]|nr:asparagine--tRNA ligase [Candidatus Dependentiae bacterium]
MEYIMIEDIRKHEDQEVELRGWLYNKRSTGKLQFLIIRDGTGFIQSVIFKGNFSEEQFDEIDKLNIESSIIIRGKVKEDKRSPIGFEIDVQDFEIVSKADDDYPIQLKEHGADFLLNHRHLWLRTPKQHAIMRIRDEIILASRNFFDTRGFTLIDTPLLSGNACEGTSTLFELDYFGQKAYLSQSGQLYNEAAALAFGKVYCFGPTFRAEKSKTRRHLTEFWMIEPEAAWYHLDDVMKLSEDYVYHLVQSVLKNRQVELKILERDISKLEKIQLPFPRLEYSEVLEKLKEIGIDFEWGKDLGAEEETKISELFDSPLLIHRYPAKAKAFYMEP